MLVDITEFSSMCTTQVLCYKAIEMNRGKLQRPNQITNLAILEHAVEVVKLGPGRFAGGIPIKLN